MKDLYDILVALGSSRPFLKEVQIDKDGYKNPFTKSGIKAYEKLISIIYCVGAICEVDVEDIVETLDAIANEQY